MTDVIPEGRDQAVRAERGTRPITPNKSANGDGPTPRDPPCPGPCLAIPGRARLTAGRSTRSGLATSSTCVPWRQHRRSAPSRPMLAASRSTHAIPRAARSKLTTLPCCIPRDTWHAPEYVCADDTSAGASTVGGSRGSHAPDASRITTRGPTTGRVLSSSNGVVAERDSYTVRRSGASPEPCARWLPVSRTGREALVRGQTPHDHE
jgi:hypothetical protein